jgi:shikimate dehydrogenase
MSVEETGVHALIGSPISHSLSPIIFNGTFQKQSLNRIYLPFDVSTDHLEDALHAIRTLRFEGFNVTIPHKTRIVGLLDQLDSEAKNIGAVNTVVRNERQKLVGYNTDGEGAVRAIKSYGFEPQGKRILMIGAGGSARALVHSLAKQECTIHILNRTANNAKQIVDNQTGTRAKITYDSLTGPSLENSLRKTNLVLNTTPRQTPELLRMLNVSLNFLKEVDFVFDLAYDKPTEPVPTKHGRISSLEMLLQQAALSYEIWIQRPAPLDLMRSTITAHLGREWR